MLPFVKLQGAGNDYIAIDGREANYDWNQLSLDMSKPAFGVGSDGIVVVFESDKADIRMRIYNPDGSEAEISGNGIRLFTKFVIDQGIISSDKDILKIETGDGIKTVYPELENGKVVSSKVEMGIPNFIASKIPISVPQLTDSDMPKFQMDILGHKLDITCLSVGNPHAVCIMDQNVEDFPLVEVGTIVEKHEYFPNRINFEIVNVISRSKIRARIFERGAGETLSSGTGSTASASASRYNGLVDDSVEVVLDGGNLNISWDQNDMAMLEGPSEEVFSGIWPK
ncbi:MAG: diaminopimelate epimerase [Dehalococcoidia bacterium]|nr:diaminopimelate epimerase [Dehalococcoidia bacterium]